MVLLNLLLVATVWTYEAKGFHSFIDGAKCDVDGRTVLTVCNFRTACSLAFCQR